ncbi:hypothetical protein N752_29345 [Desulforamulus aquiferis]|nr:biotin/lipoyl-binding protein [Desulforamulus aquiferis]RYD01683.1 hypothetical protein N752_29345 [Desulforamulus aquiferis]
MTKPSTQANNSVDNSKKKSLSKGVRMALLALVVIALAVFCIRWYIQLKTTVSTDNAKVSADLVSISAEVSGRLTHVYAQEGNTVETGQVLAQLEDTQYLINTSQAEAAWELSKIAVTKLANDITSAQLAVTKAESALSAAIAQADISKLAMEDAKRVLDNNTALYEQGAVPKETLDSYTIKYETAVKSLEAANANVNAAQDSVAAAQTQLDTLNKTGSAPMLPRKNKPRRLMIILNCLCHVQPLNHLLAETW